MPMVALVLLLVLTGGPASAVADDFGLSVGFTSDMVLQRGAQTAIYGLTATTSAKVSVVVSDDSGGVQPATYQAVVTAPSSAAAAPLAPGSGTANPLCAQRCLGAGHCCQGDTSGCNKPSCAMGCILAGRTASATVCKASCAAASKGACTYEVVSPAGPHHLPQDKLQNESFQMCSGGTVLTNGTICQSCSGTDAQNRTECEQGCDFGDKTKGAPSVWKAILPINTRAGGSYTIQITSSDAPATPIVLERVTYGDVFFCSGQSNMDLALQYTFTKHFTLNADVAAGKYKDIRLFQYGGMSGKYQELVPSWVTTRGSLALIESSGPGSAVWSNLSTASEQIPQNCAPGQAPPDCPNKDMNLLGQFSATCFYFAANLVDQLQQEKKEVYPIGLIQSAIGGSQIEAWTPDSALGKCQNESLNANGQAPPGRLFNGMVAPFVNTSVAGFLWYQGENNCGGTMGNSATGFGYGCQMPAMIDSWREHWSATPGTTDELAPFGIVTLAAGGSEGKPQNMAGMRWSQSANFGHTPNPAMPKVFLAHAYDLGDPMDNLRPPCVNHSADWAMDAVNVSSFGAAGPCSWGASKWNKGVAPLQKAVEANEAPSFMGGIHPRFKHEVGRRLALAYRGALSPTIKSCSESAAKIEIVLSVAEADKLLLQWSTEMFNTSNWGTLDKDSSGLMVCVGKAGASPPASANACLTDASLWTAFPLQLASSAPAATAPPPQKNGEQQPPLATTQVLTVLLPAGGPKPLAVRYGWPINGGDTCCPFQEVTKGLTPCVPGSCPLITATNSLPANPFYATLEGGKCKCMAPQKCDA